MVKAKRIVREFIRQREIKVKNLERETKSQDFVE
jgi:hypothetical protein